MIPKHMRYPFSEGVPENRRYSPFFSLCYSKNTLETVRVAIVTGKKVNKLSTVRHSVKRKFAEVLLEYVSDKNCSCDLVFYLKENAVAAERDELYNSLASSLKGIC